MSWLALQAIALAAFSLGCAEITCPGLPEESLRNRHLEVTSCRTGSGPILKRCGLSCSRGYLSTSVNYVYCTLSSNKLEGIWKTYYRESCTKVKCSSDDLGQLQNVKKEECKSVETGSSCELRCARGYKFVDGGRKYLSCILKNDTGVWNVSSQTTLKCKEIVCQGLLTIISQLMNASSSGKPAIIADSCKKRVMKFDSKCDLKCPDGYEFGDGGKRKRVTCDPNIGSWDPPISTCRAKIVGNRNCKYWLSRERASGVERARRRCKEVIGEHSVLAMLKTPNQTAYVNRSRNYFIGANVDHVESSVWDDGEKMSFLRGTGFCIILKRKKHELGKAKYHYLKTACNSSNFFACESPRTSHNPCKGNPCKSNGTCSAYGCSFRCECRRNFYGHTCDKGPFEVTINTTLNKPSLRIEYSVRSNVGKARFQMFVNGERTVDIANISKIITKEHESIKLGINDAYISTKTFLEKEPESSSYTCVRVPVHSAIDNVNITRHVCDGTVFRVTWNGLGTTPTSEMPYDIYVDDKLYNSSSSKFHDIIGLNSSTRYNITIVPHLEGCRDQRNLFKTYTRKTKRAHIPPSAVKLSLSSSNCSIVWRGIHKDGYQGFKVKITEVVKIPSKIPNSNFTMEYNVNEKRFSYPTSPNSFYAVAVGTTPTTFCKNVVPIVWSEEVSGCQTDFAPPLNLPLPNDVIPNTDDGTVSMELISANERNGPVRCKSDTAIA